MRLLFVVLLFLSLISCKEGKEKADSYFDSLITSQVKTLTEIKAAITKSAVIGDKEDETSFIPDSIAWENELEIFRQLSVYERPANRGAYIMQDGVKDLQSNLTVRSYVASKNIPVRELRFYYHNQFQQLKKVEAVFEETNTLFATHRNMILEFEEMNGKPVLSAYAVSGVQKMVMNDSVHFKIHSKVNF